MVTSLAIVAAGLVAFAHVMDSFGPPPPGDPSEHTGPIIGEEQAIEGLENLEHANHGAFEGGATGTSDDAGANNERGQNEVNSDREYDVPTGGALSPLFGAGEFEQQLLRFEEFGSRELAGAPSLGMAFPSPLSATSGPDDEDLEAFLDQVGISPVPTELANDLDSNPWEPEIETFLGRQLDDPPAEGRPPGKGWAHQRWNEFHPQVFFNTVQACARENGGSRDDLQLHSYSAGEFAPGGLYHRVYDPDDDHNNGNEIEGTTDGIGVRFHPDLPIQDPDSLWTFDGTFPPKLAVARYGEAILMRHYNALPIDPAANKGFGLHTISTHEHNGHNPAESDGYTNAFFFPGQFYDYRWPMQLAGYDTVNTEATDPRAAYPCAPGETLFVHDDDGGGMKTCDANGRIQIRGDWRETMSTHWFHDHMLDFTAQNVYKGNAVMFNYYSALDRGNEAHVDGVNLRLPSGTALPWGNRDYDVNLLLADKAWDENGQLWFNIFNLDGFVGDRLLTNWLYKPYFEVRARRYRFRILNGSVSRYFAVQLVKQRNDTNGEFDGPAGSGVSYDRVGFHMVANDGNIMEHAVPFDGSIDLDDDGNASEHKGLLPTQGIAERYDIVIDFASQGIQPGDKLYMVNLLEHQDGQVAGGNVSLASILNGSYEGQTTGSTLNHDPAVGKFLEFRVVSYSGTDLSMDPNNFEPGGATMIPLAIDVDDPALETARHRTFEFRDDSDDEAPWVIRTDGEEGLPMDPRRLSAAPQLATGPTMAGFDGVGANGYDSLGTMEIWTLEGNDNWSHPIHVHFEEGVIISRDGNPPPEWEKWARKDVYRLGPREDSGNRVTFAIRFREFAGTFMEHCHNTQHEDHAMLLRWDIEHPGQTKLMPAPIPTWDGVEYVDSAALPTFRTGDGFGPDGEGGDDGGGGGGGTGNVIIDRAEYDPDDEEVRVEGVVTGGDTEVSVHYGGITSDNCLGALIDTVEVDGGEFRYREEEVTPPPTTVCVESFPSGDVASSSVEID
ncbi:MAG TPA: multicopper oxidase domain-containing protein [Solirubrobacterales bacterium]|nr:multicopper oxidase domain-containing protein [Solirubrobacterales bacterium]